MAVVGVTHSTEEAGRACEKCGGSGLRADELLIPAADPRREMLDPARCQTCHGSGHTPDSEGRREPRAPFTEEQIAASEEWFQRTVRRAAQSLCQRWPEQFSSESSTYAVALDAIQTFQFESMLRAQDRARYPTPREEA